jgi:hypothetical protein
MIVAPFKRFAPAILRKMVLVPINQLPPSENLGSLWAWGEAQFGGRCFCWSLKLDWQENGSLSIYPFLASEVLKFNG